MALCLRDSPVIWSRFITVVTIWLVAPDSLLGEKLWHTGGHGVLAWRHCFVGIYSALVCQLEEVTYEGRLGDSFEGMTQEERLNRRIGEKL